MGTQDDRRRNRQPHVDDDGDLIASGLLTPGEVAQMQGRKEALSLLQAEWDNAHSPTAIHRNQFINRIQHSLKTLASTFPAKLAHINSVAPDNYDKLWVLLTLRALKELRAHVDKTTRAVVVEMITERVVAPLEAAKACGYSRTTIYNWLKEAETEATVNEPATQPEPQPVAAAIVTSKLGVLAGERNDGRPPWTFIAGEIEPGESPADAAIREVKEEAGLVVAVSHVIGRRVHPKTGRTMIYLACQPTEGTDVHVGDPDELAEVRWLSLAEANELLPGMFEPVMKHLATMIA